MTGLSGWYERQNKLKLVPLIYLFPFIYPAIGYIGVPFADVLNGLITTGALFTYGLFLTIVRGTHEYQSNQIKELAKTDYLRWPRFVLLALAIPIGPILVTVAANNPDGKIASLLEVLALQNFAELVLTVDNVVLINYLFLIIGLVSMRIVWRFDHRLWKAVDQIVLYKKRNKDRDDGTE